MHHKGLNILIQRCLSKFFLIDDFDLAIGWKGFFGVVVSPDKLFFNKLDISIIKGKEVHA